MLYNAVNNYYQYSSSHAIESFHRPGLTNAFLEQFNSIFQYSSAPQPILNAYIQMDKDSGQFEDHFHIILSDLRNKVIMAIKETNLDMYNACLSRLHSLVSSAEVSKVLITTQNIVTSIKNPKIAGLLFSDDYLCPFFDLHPGDFRSGIKLVRADLSSPVAVQRMHEQYYSLMNSMSTTNVSLCNWLIDWLIMNRTGRRPS